MNCEQVNLWLNAQLDKESNDAESHSVYEHLSRCPACRKTRHDLFELDALLRQSLVLAKPMDWIIRTQSCPPETLASGSSQVVHSLAPRAGKSKQTDVLLADGLPGTTHVRSHGWWLAGALSLSAVVILGLTANRPQVSSPPIAATLVRAIGPIEIQLPQTPPGSWSMAKLGDRLPQGVAIRTRNEESCELRTVEDAILRLDGSSELVVLTPNRLQLVQGRLWSRASAMQSLSVTISTESLGDSSVWATCPHSTELQWTATDNRFSCASFNTEPTNLDVGSFRCMVDAERSIEIEQKSIALLPEQTSLAMKLWQLPLLAQSPASEQELSGMLAWLLARMGQSKATLLDEQQIRALGPRGVLPLLIYVRLPSSKRQLGLRQHAMSMAAEMADASHQSLLRDLTNDDDAMIAQQAQSALERVIREPIR